MARSFRSAAALRLALVAAAAVSMTACASRPKPAPAPPPAPTPPPVEQPTTPPAPPPVTSQITPGSQQDFVINVGDRVYFDFDSYELSEGARPVLDAQANWLRRYPNVRVRIEGNADERGTREYNLALGARRANTVRDYLVNQGVTTDRIATISFGKEQPIDPGTTEEAFAKNRNAHTAITEGAR